MAFMNKYFVLYRPMALQIWITEFDFLPLYTTIHRRNCINSNQKEKASSNPCRSSRLFLEMFWLRNTRWSHCLSEASLRLSCMLLTDRLSHRTTERRSRCVDAFLCKLRTIHESLRLRCADAFLYRLLEKYRRLGAVIVEYKQQFPKFFTEF